MISDHLDDPRYSIVGCERRVGKETVLDNNHITRSVLMVIRPRLNNHVPPPVACKHRRPGV